MKKEYLWTALLYVSSACWPGWALTPSDPITIFGQSGVVISGVRITSTTGNCITIVNFTNIMIKESNIGPCGTASGTTDGNGISITDSKQVYVYDNYIHSETLSTDCCDFHDGIYGTGNQKVIIQGNVIAYGESNVEFNNQNFAVTVRGNFLMNPRGPFPRGQNFQCWGNKLKTACSNLTIEDNYALSSQDSSRYLYPEGQEDSINFGFTDGALVRRNYITGGHKPIRLRIDCR